VLVPAQDCPRISADFLAAERAALGACWFAQEYECVFGEPEGAAFDEASVRALLSGAVRPLW
jgi:hypothetical protein